MTWYVALTLLVSIPMALQFVRGQWLFRRLGPVLVDCGAPVWWADSLRLFSALWMAGLVLANSLWSSRTPFGPLAQFALVVMAGAQVSWLLVRYEIRERGIVTAGGGLPWEAFKSGRWKNATTVVFQTTSHCTFTLDVPADQADRCGEILERSLGIPFDPSRSAAGAVVSAGDPAPSSV